MYMKFEMWISCLHLKRAVNLSQLKELDAHVKSVVGMRTDLQNWVDLEGVITLIAAFIRKALRLRSVSLIKTNITFL